MKKVSRYFLYVFFTMLALVIAIAFLCTTTPGLRALFTIANALLPGTLTVQTVEGNLSSHFIAKDIDYTDSNYHLHLQKIDYQWSPFYWFIGYPGSATFSWEKLEGFIDKDLIFTSEHGNAKAEGKRSHYYFTATTQVNGNTIPATSFALHGNGTNETVTISDGLITLLNGTIHFTGNFSWFPRLHWTARLSTTDLNPGNYWPQWYGTINFDVAAEGKGFADSIHLQSEHFSIKKLPEYDIEISPTLNMYYTPSQITIDGVFDIEKAIIKPKDFSSTVNLPSNVTYVGEPHTTTTPTALTVHIQLNTINPAHFTYEGLDADITGNLSLKFDSNSWITASGELTASNGNYQAYGQKLTIRTGKLIYKESPLDNPTIHITAIKTLKAIVPAGIQLSDATTPSSQPATLPSSVQEITVGIRATGTLENPILTLFSEPAGLNQTDILSYLIFGHAPNKASGAQGQLLLQALSSVNVGGTSTNQVVDNLQQRLGLTTLTVESSPKINPENNELVETTSLVVGKKLSEKIEVNYSVGLDKPINVLSLKYLLSHHWFLQAQTSTVENGADLFYSIEQD